MNLLPFLLLLPFATVNVAVGPEMSVDATPAVAPIDEVTVYSDRARIRRVGRLSIPKGVTAVRLPDLPGGILLDTVRVRSRGAEVARIEVSQIQLERVSIEQVDNLLNRLEAINERVSDLQHRDALLDRLLAFTNGLKPKTAVAETERVGKRPPPINPISWTRALDFLSAERRSLYTEKAALAVKMRAGLKEHQTLRREIAKFDLGGLSDKKVRVIAFLSSPKKTRATLRLEYFVAGAHWRPSYDLHFDSNKNRVVLNAAGLIKQASGESWDNVKLRLSTALPGHSFQLPDLLTWTLGESREYVPKAFEQGQRPRFPRLAGPTPRKVAAELDAQGRRQVLAQRMTRLRDLVKRPPGDPSRPIKEGKIDFASTGLVRGVGTGGIGHRGGGQGGGGRSGRLGGKVRESSSGQRRARRRPSAPSKRKAPATYGLDDAHVAQADANMDEAMVADVPLALFAGHGPRRRTLADRTLPAMLAGGLDYVFGVPQRMTVPSKGEAIRAPYDAQRYKVDTHYEATPSIETIAYLKAAVLYTSKQPILGGPANIFINGRFTANTTLRTTGPNSRLHLPLGADEDIRLVRTIVPSSKTEGLFNTEDVTRYTVTIEVGNYKRRAISIRLFDQVPKTNMEDIKIERIRLPKGVKAPNGSGIFDQRLKLKAGETKTVVFSYDIRRPKDWRLNQ